MKRIVSYFLLPAALAVLAGCSSDDPVVENEIEDFEDASDDVDLSDYKYYSPIQVSDAERQLIDKQAENAFKMFSAVKSTGLAKDNTVISPLSISMFLSMMANATDTEGTAAILEGLGMNANDLANLNALNAKLLKTLPSHDVQAQMAIGNSLWSDPSMMTVKPSFAQEMGEGYALQLKDLGADLDLNRININGWVEEQTRGLIQDFVKDPVAGPMALFNTCYFKAPWSEKNVKGEKMIFRNLDGTNKDVEGFALNFGSAFSRDGYEVGRASYGNLAYSITFVMTESGKLPVLSEVANNWRIMNNISSQARLTIPEWDVENSLELNAALSAMGMQKIFTSRLTGIAENAPAFGGIKHAVRMITNKKGTEAAAVTGGWFGASGEPVEIKELKIDRPFLYIISETSTGAVLFIGEVTKL